MTIERKMALATAAAALLTACTPNDTGLGNAVKSNNMAQVVDPDPGHEGAASADGNQVAGAQARHRTDTVKQPTPVNTTAGGSGSGSSSGGN
ncbi:MAG: hypothetical protein ACRCY3_01025 [Sphingorhabdus sp.]